MRLEQRPMRLEQRPMRLEQRPARSMQPQQTKNGSITRAKNGSITRATRQTPPHLRIQTHLCYLPPTRLGRRRRNGRRLWGSSCVLLLRGLCCCVVAGEEQREQAAAGGFGGSISRIWGRSRPCQGVPAAWSCLFLFALFFSLSIVTSHSLLPLTLPPDLALFRFPREQHLPP